MYKPEIVAGLKNTMDRGHTLEEAIQSFINAGYDKEDVLDSAEQLRAEPTLTMQVTAPELSERKISKTGEPVIEPAVAPRAAPQIAPAIIPESEQAREKKPGFLKRMFGKKTEKKKETAKAAAAKSAVAAEKRKEEHAEPQEIKRKELLEIRRIEEDLKRKNRPEAVRKEAEVLKKEEEAVRKESRAEPKEIREVETTAILNLQKAAPKAVVYDKRPVALGKISKPSVIRKAEPKIIPESTVVLGLRKAPPKRSNNWIFVILIVMMLILLGGLVFLILYRERLIELIETLLNR